MTQVKATSLISVPVGPAPVRVAVAGAGGRMGQALIKALPQAPGVRLRGALVAPSSPLVGVDAGALVGLPPVGVLLTHQLAAAVAAADVLIDFTTPTATLEHLAYCCQQRKAMVIGTTGFDEAARAQIAQAATQIAIVMAANFSIGLHVLSRLLITATQDIGQQSDIDILERHHRHKRDTPSGSALAMGEVIATVLERSFPQCAYWATSDRRAQRMREQIGIASVRSGEVIGEHTVTFNTGNEQLAITHIAHNRQAFADGALLAAHWLMRKPAALYDLQHVLASSED